MGRAVADPEPADCDVHTWLQRGINHSGFLIVEVRPYAGASFRTVACEARGAHASVPTYERRTVVLEPVRDVGRAAAQELAAEHRQSTVDVSLTGHGQALVGEARHGQIGPLAVVAATLANNEWR